MRREREKTSARRRAREDQGPGDKDTEPPGPCGQLTEICEWGLGGRCSQHASARKREAEAQREARRKGARENKLRHHEPRTL